MLAWASSIRERVGQRTDSAIFLRTLIVLRELGGGAERGCECWKCWVDAEGARDASLHWDLKCVRKGREK